MSNTVSVLVRSSYKTLTVLLIYKVKSSYKTPIVLLIYSKVLQDTHCVTHLIRHPTVLIIYTVKSSYKTPTVLLIYTVKSSYKTPIVLLIYSKDLQDTHCVTHLIRHPLCSINE
jgi:hypothetical protein